MCWLLQPQRWAKILQEDCFLETLIICPKNLLGFNGEIANKFQIYPDLIIEILSPDQFPNRVIDKIIFCINHGTKLGWFIDSNDKSVIVFQPNKLPEVKYNNEKLTVLDVLADWQITPADILSWLKVK
ncbi:Uma2 family endonuclease [Nostoc sp. XA010]|uniref:Uma2 family endonuclease n=1 Tax=Nostoc sp. XA010 TaxID=2780407 RepID=UPI001E3B5A03|nr:Uma2 family endonuclease [Nostoc sp. XA010]MCC5658865.1 Uma2 family endonuclease [Nostoc sp. XA010]